MSFLTNVYKKRPPAASFCDNLSPTRTLTMRSWLSPTRATICSMLKLDLMQPSNPPHREGEQLRIMPVESGCILFHNGREHETRQYLCYSVHHCCHSRHRRKPVFAFAAAN